MTTKTKFSLRSFAQSDVGAFVEGLNTKTMGRDTTIDLPWDASRASWWISFVGDAAKQNPLPEIHFAIDIDGKLAGSVALINIDGHKGELGYWLVDKYSGQGIMTNAIAEAVKYGFESLGMVRIFAPVLIHNKASSRVLEKNGFELEGVNKSFFKKNGKYIDAFCYARVR